MTSVPRICSVEGCEREHKGLGYCNLHYTRYKKYGSLDMPDGFIALNRKYRMCSVDGCSRESSSNGLCKKHFMRWWHHDDPTILIKEHEYHNMWGAPEYTSWSGMKSRCINKHNPKYKNYGGRGIKTCKRWRDSFIAFYEDMGKKPDPSLSIDRIDNDGNYSCGKCEECVANGWTSNCQWADKYQQSYNKRLQWNNTSGYRGLHWDIKNSKWQVRITIKRKIIHLGRFADIEQAALAYDCAAIQLYGNDAKLNILGDF